MTVIGCRVIFPRPTHRPYETAQKGTVNAGQREFRWRRIYLRIDQQHTVLQKMTSKTDIFISLDALDVVG